MWFVRFVHGQQKFCSFNFRKWLLIREKRENKSLVKITNHTVLRVVYFSSIKLLAHQSTNLGYIFVYQPPHTC